MPSHYLVAIMVVSVFLYAYLFFCWTEDGRRLSLWFLKSKYDDFVPLPTPTGWKLLMLLPIKIFYRRNARNEHRVVRAAFHATAQAKRVQEIVRKIFLAERNDSDFVDERVKTWLRSVKTSEYRMLIARLLLTAGGWAQTQPAKPTRADHEPAQCLLGVEKVFIALSRPIVIRCVGRWLCSVAITHELIHVAQEHTASRVLSRDESGMSLRERLEVEGDTLLGDARVKYIVIPALIFGFYRIGAFLATYLVLSQ